jgi:hypothetical protein
VVSLFAKITPIEPSAWLKETLQKASFLRLTNEKSKSERIISPILVEVAAAYATKISFFSGEAINVRPKDNLAGECDFIFTLYPQKPYVEAPIISLAEAKDEDMEWGLAQCAAQLYGAKLFNDLEGQNIPILYGCTTDGVEWQFMRFENNIFFIDNKIYTDLKEILGMWHTIIQLYVGNPA